MNPMLPTPKTLATLMGPLHALPGAFGNAETEAAAALIICTLADLESDWAPVSGEAVGEYFMRKRDEDRKHVFNNPFFRPMPDRLARRGLATFNEGYWELTEEAIERCAKSLGAPLS